MLEGSCHCGKVHWHLKDMPKSVTACNCTICRRYGVLWAYGHFGHEITVSGDTKAYRRADSDVIDFHFCPSCGCVTHYVGTAPLENGRFWSAVNVRLAEPERIADLPIDHFDGLETFKDLPGDGRTVRDLWF